MTQLRHTINELKSKIAQINQQITAIAQESQKHHAPMNEKIAQRNQKRSEADQAHQHYLEAMQIIRQHEKDYCILNNQLRELSQRLKRDRQEKLNTNLESQRDIVITKLNENKKISFEEYKVLKEKGLI